MGMLGCCPPEYMTLICPKVAIQGDHQYTVHRFAMASYYNWSFHWICLRANSSAIFRSMSTKLGKEVGGGRGSAIGLNPEEVYFPVTHIMCVQLLLCHFIGLRPD